MPEPVTQLPQLVAGQPPTAADLERWRAADRAARPNRLARLRERMATEGVDAYFGVRRENARYLTGIELGDGEEKVAGNSGQFFISPSEVAVLADSRYTLQAAEECPDARVEQVYHDLISRWPELLASIGNPRRLAVEGGFVSYSMWQRLAGASPGVELVPAEGWVEQLRATKEPAEIERVASACAVADGALERLLPNIIPGITEEELALQLEWEMRTSGAEALSFGVACLFGERAALPHGSPGRRPIAAEQVLLFDFGAQVAGYRSDMTRTLFVGQPSDRDLVIYELVANAQQAAFDALAAAVQAGERPIGREIDGVARAVIEAAGHGERFGHGLGHGIGLATHELPSLAKSAPPVPLPSPTVFSIEPGIYLDGVTGVRIEDLVLFDADARRLERLTSFPREVTVVG
jgi:Xaa-Pro aminopeptidase